MGMAAPVRGWQGPDVSAAQDTPLCRAVPCRAVRACVLALVLKPRGRPALTRRALALLVR